MEMPAHFSCYANHRHNENAKMQERSWKNNSELWPFTFKEFQRVPGGSNEFFGVTKEFQGLPGSADEFQRVKESWEFQGIPTSLKEFQGVAGSTKKFRGALGGQTLRMACETILQVKF